MLRSDIHLLLNLRLEPLQLEFLLRLVLLQQMVRGLQTLPPRTLLLAQFPGSPLAEVLVQAVVPWMFQQSVQQLAPQQALQPVQSK